MAAVRNTVQKKLVYDAEHPFNHPTAEEVYFSVAHKYPTISRATVYRILNGLSAQNTLVRIKIPGGADRYDDSLEEHCHIRCTKCGRIDDVQIEPINFKADFKGYRVLKHTLVFEGICPDCGK